MIKQWSKKKLARNAAAGEVRRSVDLIVEGTAAVSIIRKLVQAGYEAYLVGGAVRDLLLGVQPKDFDVVTNATPEQVKALFRRSRIVGRRFPIVHVPMGAETVEVSTFRSGQVRQNDAGRVVRDNAYGTMAQDAVRRDFTCNALYYDVIKGEVIDFHQGMDDIAAQRLVMIGDAAERYCEDPVRILRAVRLSGKLGFEVAAETAAPIAAAVHLLAREPQSRLFDELLKILFCGYAEACLRQLAVLGVGDEVHPFLSVLQQGLEQDTVVAQALRGTDARVREGKTVSAGFMLAALLWARVRPLWQRNIGRGQSPAAAMGDAVLQIRGGFERDWGVPQRYSAVMREIWLMQPQFAHQRGGRPFRLLAQPRFRAAYDFLLIRAAAGEADAQTAEWWTQFQAANEAQRKQMTSAQPNTASGDAPAKKKRRRRRRKSATSANKASES